MIYRESRSLLQFKEHTLKDDKVFGVFFSFSCGRVKMISKRNVWTGAFFNRGEKIPVLNKTDNLLADNDDDDDDDASL